MLALIGRALEGDKEGGTSDILTLILGLTGIRHFLKISLKTFKIFKQSKLAVLFNCPKFNDIVCF